jgi:glycosyltransferase involved in cell wall biosynthesis
VSSLPEISVVVPTYRRPELLPRLVAALEAQTIGVDRFEVLIVDDRSGDDTQRVLAELGASTPLQLRALVTTANNGPAGARNLGWKTARAPFVAFTDDDCVPEPDWLAWGIKALQRDAEIGVVQGCTLKPRGDHAYTNWTVYREIVTPSPWFEGCNLFFRRAALEAGGGFDESIHLGGEDTAAGWSALAAGWRRDFERDAVVRHDLVERGVRWHMKMTWREGETLKIARRYPDLQRLGFWRPWALRPGNVVFAVGVLGTVASPWRRSALLLWLPWFVFRRPPRSAPHWLRFLGERWLVDASAFGGMAAGSVKARRFSL